MKSSRISSLDDEDWYRKYFSSNVDIFVDLRNIGNSNIDIALYNSNGTELWNSANITRFS